MYTHCDRRKQSRRNATGVGYSTGFDLAFYGSKTRCLGAIAKIEADTCVAIPELWPVGAYSELTRSQSEKTKAMIDRARMREMKQLEFPIDVMQ